MRCGKILKCVEGNAAVACGFLWLRMVYFPKKVTFSDSMKGRNFPTRWPIMNSRRAMPQGVIISNLQENCQQQRLHFDRWIVFIRIEWLFLISYSSFQILALRCVIGHVVVFSVYQTIRAGRQLRQKSKECVVYCIRAVLFVLLCTLHTRINRSLSLVTAAH